VSGRPNKISVRTSRPNLRTESIVLRANPTHWSSEDARRCVWTVWRELHAHVGESLLVRRLPDGRHRLEFVADSGAATSEPLMFSMAALTWLERVSFGSRCSRAINSHACFLQAWSGPRPAIPSYRALRSFGNRCFIDGPRRLRTHQFSWGVESTCRTRSLRFAR